jgi:uncharacterized iron-regulated membrane protein
VQHRPIPSAQSVYARVWRWHFYAGLYVAPFMLVLAVTGLVQLSKGHLDQWLYADRLFVPAPGPARLSIDEQLDAAGRAFPDRTLTQVTPAFDPSRSSEVLTTQDGVTAAVYVDPTSGVVLGEVLDSRRPGIVATTIHGTLLAGRVGDWLIEIAAGLGIVLVVSGLYLWWPRGGWLRAFQIAWVPRRLVFRDLHKLIGVALAPVLMFYLLTGLTWTEVWGERFTQAWSTFPAEKSAPAGATTAGAHAVTTHGDVLNGPGRLLAPWGIEQTPVPLSILTRQHDHHGGQLDHGNAPPARVTADEAIAIARASGIGDRFVVGVPAGATGVWTVSTTGMSGLLADPRDELTVHVDQYSGDVRGVIAWSDYSLPAKAMAVSVPLHQGTLGAWSVWTASGVCLAVIGLAGTGLLTWWSRRPSRVWRLAAPPLSPGMPPPRVAIATAVLIGLAFPLVGLTFVVVGLVDGLIVQRLPRLRAVLE